MNQKDLEELDPLKKAPKMERERAFVRLPVPLKAELEKMAKKKDISLNAFIVHACVQILKS